MQQQARTTPEEEEEEEGKLLSEIQGWLANCGQESRRANLRREFSFKMPLVLEFNFTIAICPYYRHRRQNK